MSDTVMRVELVAADRLVWSGDAKMVIARTTEGDVGILPNHAPMLSTMVHGVVDVTTVDGETWIAAVDAGFLSVANNRISILSEHAQMSARHRPREGPYRLRAGQGRGRERRRVRGRGREGVRRGPDPGGREGLLTLRGRRGFATGEERGDRWRGGSGWSTLSASCCCSCSLYGIALVVRRRWMSRHGGTFEFSVRVRSGRAGRGWILGLARYTGSDLEWFRIFSAEPRPKLCFRRASSSTPVVATRSEWRPTRCTRATSIVTCRTPTGPLEVAMSPEALTGFLAWLEAAPPGQSQPPRLTTARRQSAGASPGGSPR